MVAFILIFSIKWMSVTLNSANLVNIGIYGWPWVVALKVKYYSYVVDMVWVFSTILAENLIPKKMIPHIRYTIASNYRTYTNLTLNLSHLTLGSIETISSGVCPIIIILYSMQQLYILRQHVSKRWEDSSHLKTDFMRVIMDNTILY